MGGYKEHFDFDENISSKSGTARNEACVATWNPPVDHKKSGRYYLL